MESWTSTGCSLKLNRFICTYVWDELAVGCRWTNRLSLRNNHRLKWETSGGFPIIIEESNSPPTLTGVGHQWTVSTSTGCNQWLSLVKSTLKVLPAGRNLSLAACTNKCGWVIRRSIPETNESSKTERLCLTCNNNRLDLESWRTFYFLFSLFSPFFPLTDSMCPKAFPGTDLYYRSALLVHWSGASS